MQAFVPTFVKASNGLLPIAKGVIELATAVGRISLRAAKITFEMSRYGIQEIANPPFLFAFIVGFCCDYFFLSFLALVVSGLYHTRGQRALPELAYYYMKALILNELAELFGRVLRQLGGF